MSVTYSGTYAYRSKFDGSLHESSDDAMECDFVIAATTVNRATVADLMQAALEEEYGDKSELRQAIDFLINVGPQIRYARKHQDEANAA